MICKKCGCEVSEVMKKCPRCGEDLNRMTDEQKPKKVIFEKNPSKLIIQITAIIIGIFYLYRFINMGILNITKLTGISSLFPNIVTSAAYFLSVILKFSAGVFCGMVVLILADAVINWKNEDAHKYLIASASVSLISLVCAGLSSLLSFFGSLFAGQDLAQEVLFARNWQNLGSFAFFIVMSNAIWAVSMYVGKVNVIENINTLEMKYEFWSSVFFVFDEIRETFESFRNGNTTSTLYEKEVTRKTATDDNGERVRIFIPLNTNRSLLMYIILNVFTCGLYHFYFSYKLVSDLNIACEGDDNELPNYFVMLLLSVFTCGIYGYVWLYKLGNKLRVNGYRYGETIYSSGIVLLFWYFMGTITCGLCYLFAKWMIIEDVNKLCRAYNDYNNQL